MSWLFPGFLAGAALIGLPVLLHFLRSKPKTLVPFPSLRFLGDMAIRDTRRHRIQRWITLLLRCLVIAALAAAFARPFWQGAAAKNHQALVVALDNSMSMQAQGRWDARRAQALVRVAKLGEGDRAGLMVMFPRPTWIVPMTDDIGRVRSALANATPGFENTRYAPGLKAAIEALESVPAAERTLLWVADEQRAGWLGVDLARPVPAGIKLELGDVAPSPGRQAAIVRLQRDGKTRVTATVRLFSPDKDRREIIFGEGSRELGHQAVELVSGENTIPLEVPADIKYLRVSMVPADDLKADDTAWIVLEQKAGNAVLLDPVEGPDFLAHALQSTKKIDSTGLDASGLPKGAWPADSPVILRSAQSFMPPRVSELDRFVGAGGPLLVFVDGSPSQTAWLAKQGIKIVPRSGTDTPWNLRDWDAEHPILAAYAGQSLLPLLQVDFQEGFNLEGAQLAPVANWPDGAMALAEWNNQGRRALIAGFPMTREATNWPAQPSFVPFIHQAANWLGSFSLMRHECRIGDTIPLPPGEGTWRLVDPPDPSAPRTAAGSVRPGLPGVYEFASGQDHRLYAVNIPPAESDLAPWPDPVQLHALANPAKAAGNQAKAPPSAGPAGREISENQQRLWWWVLAFCGLALMAELALANRTAL